MSNLNLDGTRYDGDREKPAAPALEPGTLFAGRYEIEGMLGQGGMGTVYRARDRTTREEIALKLLHPALFSSKAAMDRLVGEGTLARKIRHPNIVAVHDVAEIDGQPYLAMEYVEGGTMRDWLTRTFSSQREIPAAIAVAVIREILAGLGEAHRIGVVHRDLKPENVLLTGDPLAGDLGLKILDFGIAKGPQAVQTGTGGTPGRSAGTLGYMAPEQRTMADAARPQADLYSVAVMLYELLMESIPEGQFQMPGAIRGDVPREIDKIIEKGMSTRPRDRFASTQEFVAALDAATGPAKVKPQTGPQPEPSIWSPAPPPPPPDNELRGDSRRKVEEKTLDVKPAAKPPDRRLWWAAGIGGFLLLGAIGNMMDRPRPVVESPRKVADDTPPARNGGTWPPPPPAASFNASGQWITDQGAAYSVVHNQGQFTLSGSGPNGAFSASGQLTASSCNFNWVATGAQYGSGTGGCRVMPDQRHVAFGLFLNGQLVQDGCYHINHQPNPPRTPCYPNGGGWQ